MAAHIYYRWDGLQLGDIDSLRQSQAKAIQTLINSKFPGKEEIIKVTPVKIKINSEGKTPITNRIYLDQALGTGGHIIGFFNYQIGQEDVEILNYTTFSSSQAFFRQTPKYLYLLTNPSFPDTVKSTIYSVSNADLDNTIRYCPGIIKFASLGSLMPSPYTNTAEVNFVGKVDLDGYRIEFGDEASDTSMSGSPDDEESSSEDEAPPPKKAFFNPPRPPVVMRRTGGQTKRGREQAGVPASFSKVLDAIVTTEGIMDSIPGDRVISAEDCSTSGGKRKTRKHKLKRRKTNRRGYRSK